MEGMIKVRRKGFYHIVAEGGGDKYLVLDKKLSFRWMCQDRVEKLEFVNKAIDDKKAIITSGRYRLYDVRDESHLTNLHHFEMLTGKNMWQGYLLPEGLPEKNMKKKLIFPTKELITYTPAQGNTLHYDSNSFAKSAAL